MKAVCLIVACLLTSISVKAPSEAKEWRGIKPLDSTRADVKRLLGTPQQSTDHAFYYSLPEEIAVIWFQLLAIGSELAGIFLPAPSLLSE